MRRPLPSASSPMTLRDVASSTAAWTRWSASVSVERTVMNASSAPVANAAMATPSTTA